MQRQKGAETSPIVMIAAILFSLMLLLVAIALLTGAGDQIGSIFDVFNPSKWLPQ